MGKKEPRTVSIYLRPALETELEARGDNRNHVIHRDLERLYTLYRLALREVKLTLPEAWFIVDMLNGTIMDANTAGLLWASAEDACALDGLDKKWQVDGKAFVKKLKALSDVQALALVDAAERFWQANTGSTECEIQDLFFEDDEDIKRFFGVAIAEHLPILAGGKAMKTKRDYEEWLNELGAPEEDKRSNEKKVKEESTMTHEEMMSKAWKFIEEAGITEDKAAYQEDSTLILVDDVYKVRDAYYDDLENGFEDEDEDVYEFLDRHGIKWQ